MKILPYLAVLFPISICAHADPIYPNEGKTEVPPYILNVHGCDLKNMTQEFRAPIKRDSSYRALIVPPSRYWKIQQAVNNEFLRALESNTELKHARQKTHEFEESGNMQAMEHWQNKAKSIELEIMRANNRKLLPQYAEQIITQENPPVYFGREVTDTYKTHTLDELIEATGNNCIKKMS